MKIKEFAEKKQDSPENMARDYNILMDDFDPHGYRDLYGIGHLNLKDESIFEFKSVKRAVKMDAKAISKGGEDFNIILEILNDLVGDGDQSMNTFTKRAQALLIRLNTYAEKFHHLHERPKRKNHEIEI